MFPWTNAFVGQGQSQFEAPVKRPRPKSSGKELFWDVVKQSRLLFGRSRI